MWVGQDGLIRIHLFVVVVVVVVFVDKHLWNKRMEGQIDLRTNRRTNGPRQGCLLLRGRICVVKTDLERTHASKSSNNWNENYLCFNMEVTTTTVSLYHNYVVCCFSFPQQKKVTVPIEQMKQGLFLPKFST